MWQWRSLKFHSHLFSKMKELCRTVQTSQWSCSQLDDRKHVWIAAGRRVPCQQISVCLTTCHVTRSNTVCRVRVFKFNSCIKTLDGVLMIQSLCKSLLIRDSDVFRSNLILAVIFSFISMVTSKETTFNSRLIFLSFSKSVATCGQYT